MKKILSIFAFVIFALSTTAQHKDALPSEKVKKELEIIKKADLGLSEIQVGRLTVVLMGEESNFLRVQKAFEGNKSQLEIYSKEMHINKINNIKGTMSPQQAEKFDAAKIADKL